MKLAVEIQRLRRSVRILILLTHMMVPLWVPACSVPDHGACLADLNRNLELWKKSNTADYSFVVTRFVGGQTNYAPFLIKVRNQEPISMEPTEEPKELVRTDGYEDFATVEKMFSQIRAGCGNGSLVRAEYDKELGYPVRIVFSPKSGGVDSQFTIKIQNFEVSKSE